MTTTIVLTRGDKWSHLRLYDYWGDCGEGADIDATYKMLGDLVVQRFHELCEQNDIDAYWTPYTSEVLGPTDQDFDDRFPTGPGDDDILDLLRTQAAEEIGEQWTNSEIEPVMAGANT